ncbi:MAG TPA: hypothetical protein VF908_08800, partial [Gemmatimonadaceae bacterium]
RHSCRLKFIVPGSARDVLFGAVSSHARRWGALARPNGGLLLRVPLRGHPRLPAQNRNYTRDSFTTPARSARRVSAAVLRAR